MELDFALGEKVVVVTGGAGLIGRQFCQEIAKHGGVAIVADVDLDSARSVADAICSKQRGRAVAIALDITDSRSIDALLDEVTLRFSRVDALVNNAYPRNKRYGAKFEDVRYEDFTENLSTHLGGYFLTSQRFFRVFRHQGFGNIVNMASIYGVVAPRFDVYENLDMTMPVEYAAIKSAIIHLTRCMAAYFKGSNVRVNCLSPGGILDRQDPKFLGAYREYCSSKGMLDVEDIVPALLFLLSDGARHFNGQNLIVDDGFCL